MPLKPAEVALRLVDALAASTESLSVATDLRRRPLLLDARIAGVEMPLRVFIWRIEHGGATRSPNEYRVQTTRPRAQPLLAAGNRQTLLLGHHEQLDVFAAWDVHKHPNPRRSSSLQVSLETLQDARESGFASQLRQIRTGSELVMAFRPDAVETYLEVVRQLDVAGLDSASPDVETATRGEEVTHFAAPADEPRRRSLHTVAELVRDRRFRTHVLRAYTERCAFCDLGLGIVQAAHVRPVADGGPDTVTNGIAACPNHHQAFDRGLLLIAKDGRITLNEPLAISQGIDAEDRQRFRAGLRKRLRLPSDGALHPDPAHLEWRRSRSSQ